MEDLYRFRDLFFESHSLDEAANRHKLVAEKMEVAVQELDRVAGKSLVHLLLPLYYSRPFRFSETHQSEIASNPKLKAQSLFCRGRALNINPEHNPEAEKLLSRSVKLDPTLVRAWNELGDCYWKRGDIQTARTCFEGALNHVRADTKTSAHCLLYSTHF